MTSTPQRSLPVGVGSKTWPDDAVVHPGAAARFGDPIWDLTALRTVNSAPSRNLLSFDLRLPNGWSLLAREMCMARIDVRTARRAGIILKRPVKVQTTYTRFYLVRRVARFADDTGRDTPASWSHDDADALLRWHAGRTRNQRELVRTVEFVRELHRFGPLLSDGGLRFEPWPRLSNEQVLKLVLGDSAPARSETTATPVVALEAFIPLILAARAYLEVFAPDILGLHRLMRALPTKSQGQPDLDLVRAWAADPANLVPIHTMRSAAGSRKSAGVGDPIWGIVARHVGISWKSMRPPECRQIVRDAAASGRVYEGFAVRSAMIELADGSQHPWRGPFESFSDINRERGMLRAAAYIVLVALTGMRDSEVQDIERDAVHDYYGTPALRTRRYKMRLAEPEPISWWVCDLALVAYRALEELSDHPTHVMAAVVRGGRPGFNARMAMHTFVAHINATIDATGLAPIPDMEQISPQVLRETAAYAMGRFTELGDLVVGHLFGHARSATTASYQRHRPGDSWNARVHEGEIDATVVLLETMAQLVDGGEPIIGVRADELREAALEVRATIITDRAHAKRIAELHRESWHHGDVVSCRFDAGAAVCHRLARQMGVSDPGPGPLHDLCVGPGCGNAHYTPLQLPRLRQRRRDTAERLAEATAGSAAARQLAVDLDEADALIDRLEGNP